MYIIHNINTKDGGKRGVKNALLEEEKKQEIRIYCTFRYNTVLYIYANAVIRWKQRFALWYRRGGGGSGVNLQRDEDSKVSNSKSRWRRRRAMWRGKCLTTKAVQLQRKHNERRDADVKQTERASSSRCLLCI